MQCSLSVHNSASNHVLTNTTTLEMGGVTLKNIFNWRRVRAYDFAEEGFPQSIVSVESAVRARQISEEFQVIGSVFEDKLDYIAGVYYSTAKGHKIGRSHVCTPVTNAQRVCRLLL